VFWIDRLAPEAFQEGFGLQTPMVTGQTEVVRYFPYCALALEVTKRMVREGLAHNVHDQRFYIPPERLSKLDSVKNVHTLYAVVQQPFYVETPCHSIAQPGKTMAGTRITLLSKDPDGFEYTIRTPGTPSRWIEYDKEMTNLWKLINDEALKASPDRDK
jgi:hypothetical protein